MEGVRISDKPQAMIISPCASAREQTWIGLHRRPDPQLRCRAMATRLLFLSIGTPLALQGAAAFQACSRVTRSHLGTVRRMVSTRAASRVYEEGQDPSEMFDLYHEPSEEERAGALVESPRPLGRRKARSQVHADGDWHRAVHVWLIDDHGGLLLQRRSPFKDTFPDRWDVSVGGHIEAGDESLLTAVREIEEELGVRGPLTDRLEKLFTLACTNTGATAKHGAFVCNEFQDIYLLPVGEHRMSEYTYAPGEITELRVLHHSALAEKLAHRDSDYVPRASHYQLHFFAKLRERYG